MKDRKNKNILESVNFFIKTPYAVVS